MRATRLHSPRHPGLAWLFWLALLLPLAQSAAAWHACSHLAEDVAAAAENKHPPDRAHCDLCLSAATVGGGALVGDQPALPLRDAGHEPPLPGRAGVWSASPTPAYRSRAPPSAPR